MFCAAAAEGGREGGNCERVLTFYVGEVVRLILQPPLHWAAAKSSSSLGSTRGGGAGRRQRRDPTDAFSRSPLPRSQMPRG